jgi:histidinol-phosphatase
VPVWGTLIALVVDEDPVLGLVAAPALGRRWWAAKGSGAWAGRSLTSASRINVSGVSRLEDASLSVSSMTSWDAVGRSEAMLDLARSCWRERGFGDFWSYMLLAEGAVDIAAEPELALYDMAALAPIVTEAGGRFTSLSGVDGPFGGNALATNGLLHDRVLDLIGL